MTTRSTGALFFLGLFASLSAWACGGAGAPSGAGEPGEAEAEEPADPYAQYAELEVGADYQSWRKANTESFLSPTHGERFVDVYVNDVGFEAYLDESAEIPVGTVIVKPSWESEGGEATEVAGPLFVMEKRNEGFDAENHEWWYALHWAEVPPAWQERMKGAEQVYWRTPSERVSYCSGCHNDYPRQLGMIPDGKRVEVP